MASPIGCIIAFSFFITEVCTALKRWKGGFDAFQLVVLLLGW
jgi:hypothetical protein